MRCNLIKIAFSGITQQTVAVVQAGAVNTVINRNSSIISQEWPDKCHCQCPNMKITAATNFSDMAVK